MSHQAHLWAIGYDNPDRAEEVRREINELRRDGRTLRVLDTAVVARRSDGALTLDGEPFCSVRHDAAHGFSRLLVCFALAVPMLTNRAVEECLDVVSANRSYDGVIESHSF